MIRKSFVRLQIHLERPAPIPLVKGSRSKGKCVLSNEGDRVHTARGSIWRLTMPAAGLTLLVIFACSVIGPTAEATQGGSSATTPMVRQATPLVVVTKRFTRTSYDRSLRCPRTRGAVIKFFDDVYAQQINCSSPTYRGRSVSRNKWLFLASQNDPESYEVTRIPSGEHRYVFRVVCREAPRPDFGSAPPSDFVPCRLKATAGAVQAAGQSATAASTKKEVRSQKQSSGLSCLAAKASAAKAFPRHRFTIKSRRTKCVMYADIPNSAIVVTTRWDYIVTKVQRGVYPLRHWEDIVDREVHVP